MSYIDLGRIATQASSGSLHILGAYEAVHVQYEAKRLDHVIWPNAETEYKSLMVWIDVVNVVTATTHTWSARLSLSLLECTDTPLMG